MKIEKIKKTSKDKYKIVFEDNSSLTTYDDVILKEGLLYKKELTSDIINKIQVENNYYDIYNKTIKFISKKLRSEYEIEKFLEKQEISKELKNDIKEKLKSLNLINDFMFTKAYIYDRFNLSSDGPNKIKKDLYDYKIDEKIIEENILLLKEEDIKNKLNKIIEKKIKGDHKHSIYFIKQKITLYLIDLGYDKNLIEECLNSIKINSNIEKEYNLLYKKLYIKYEGEELIRNLKQKLYQKGYSSEEINEQIKKLVS